MKISTIFELNVELRNHVLSKRVTHPKQWPTHGSHLFFWIHWPSVYVNFNLKFAWDGTDPVGLWFTIGSSRKRLNGFYEERFVTTVFRATRNIIFVVVFFFLPSWQYLHNIIMTTNRLTTGAACGGFFFVNIRDHVTNAIVPISFGLTVALCAGRDLVIRWIPNTCCVQCINYTVCTRCDVIISKQKCYDVYF